MVVAATQDTGLRGGALIVLLAVVGALLAAGTARGQEGSAERGAGVYARRCQGCHGEEGDGEGPAAERLNPPPRDFTSAQFKIKTTGFDDIAPNDSDLVRMIRDGMPGTAMPGWGDVLSEQQIADLVAYIKVFAELEEEQPSDQVDYGTRVPSSPESIARGKELFHDGDRCAECHGAAGKGDAIKRLKDDAGNRDWPRNLTKPWTFRASNDPKDIFTRITVGIPGTPMPSFADPASNKRLSIEERWHVANYVASLAKTEQVVRAENTVIKAEKLAGALPADPDDAVWVQATPTTFFLVPQLLAEERLFTPSNDTLTVRALYNAEELALLLEWDDRTRSIPGDERAEKIADPPIGEDAVAVQLPVTLPEGMEKPYFGMGDPAHPVNLWYWKSGTSEGGARIELLNATGLGRLERRDPGAVGLQASARYADGTWRVVIRRPRAAPDPARDVAIEEGRFIPIAFAAWDGSNGERGSRHTMTTWYWLLLKPPVGGKPYVLAVLVFLLILAAELWWARSAAARPLAE